HLINGEHYAGAERVQDLLAARLPALGYEVAFACLKPGQFAASRQTPSAPLYDAPMRSKFDRQPVRDVVRLLRDGGFDILHTHNPRAALVGSAAARRAGVPWVHHLHSPTSRDTTRGWPDRINAIVERFLLRRAAAVITVSHSLADYARESGIKSDRIHVVHNGVACRGPLAPRVVPDRDWTLGVVALFRPRKGLETLLDALARLLVNGHHVRLTAVGGFETPDYEAAIHSQVDRLGLAGVVDWRGFQRDVDRELAAMDLFVLPSLFGEGLPMVVLEAMACGTPVVGTRVEGTPEAVRDGLDGVLAIPGDADDLARSIERFLSGEIDWQRVRTSAHRRQADQFSDQSMAAGVARVYETTLAARDARTTAKAPVRMS
ncbi:MAG: glycosyltransferase, partial [Planctomycetales bacterium]|nr:glycosyltransferase [Planctomycetales bacterium]